MANWQYLTESILAAIIVTTAPSSGSTLSPPSPRTAIGSGTSLCAGPISYVFVAIAETGPESPFRTLGVGQALNDRGEVAFVATHQAGGSAIYKTGSAGLVTIAQTGQDDIADIIASPYMNDRGVVSVVARLTDGATALFTGDGGGLTRLADTEPTSPFAVILTPAPRIDDAGALWFRGTLRSGGTGFFGVDGSHPRILYLTGGQIAAFPAGPGKQVGADGVGFRATLTEGMDGVIFGNGRETELVATVGPTYAAFLGTESNDLGTLAITADMTTGEQAIIVSSGSPRTFTTWADTSGAYTALGGLGRISLNNRGTIVFGADLTTPPPPNASGIFRGPDAVADKILALGDDLFDSTVAGFPANFLNPRGLNNEEQVVFRANLADGRTVVVRADPQCSGPR